VHIEVSPLIGHPWDWCRAASFSGTVLKSNMAHNQEPQDLRVLRGLLHHEFH
jgi:hypothetical protein